MKRMMRIDDVVEYTGFGKTFIYDEMNAGRFPSSIQVTSKSVRWLKEEIDEWIDNQRDKNRQSEIA